MLFTVIMVYCTSGIGDHEVQHLNGQTSTVNMASIKFELKKLINGKL
jgi:hypothetical protein